MAKDKAYMARYRSVSVGSAATEAEADRPAEFATEREFEDAVYNNWSGSSNRYRNPEDDEMRAEAAAFDAEIAKHSFDGEIRRGISLTDSELSNMQVGGLIDQKGPSSWTKRAFVATDFAWRNSKRYWGNPVVFVMSGGTKSGMDISRLSKAPGEEEVAVSKRSRQRVIRRDERNGVTFIYVEEV